MCAVLRARTKAGEDRETNRAGEPDEGVRHGLEYPHQERGGDEVVHYVVQRLVRRGDRELDELLEKERLRAEREGTSPRPERPARRKNLPLVSVLADEPEEEDPEDRACLICEL